MRVQAALIIVLIYMTSPAWAAGKEFVRNTDLQKDSRAISSISELIPELDNLNCNTKCQGRTGCEQFTNVDSCLNNDLLDENGKGCFWSCE